VLVHDDLEINDAIVAALVTGQQYLLLADLLSKWQQELAKLPA
jgi:hypothetical protein